jgi:hypothetical protein
VVTELNPLLSNNEFSHYGIKNYGIEVTFSGRTCMLNFTKIYRLVEKLLGGDTQTDWWSDSLLSFLKGSRPKMK